MIFSFQGSQGTALSFAVHRSQLIEAWCAYAHMTAGVCVCFVAISFQKARNTSETLLACWKSLYRCCALPQASTKGCKMARASQSIPQRSFSSIPFGAFGSRAQCSTGSWCFAGSPFRSCGTCSHGSAACSCGTYYSCTHCCSRSCSAHGSYV